MKATALLFPGQGSQEAGMGRDTADAHPEIMDLWKKAESASGAPLRSIYWESNDTALMADTRHLQPALTLVNIALWQELSSRVSPACAAGHSLGEYSAYAASGALPVDEVLRLVSLRGALMAEADPDGKGGMAAVLKLSRQDVVEVAEEAAKASGAPLQVANFNTPSQFVISGAKSAIEAAMPLVKARKGRAMALPVSSAFHTPLMEKAAAELGKALSQASWKSPRFPVYSNVTAAPVSDPASLCELAIRQMTSPVLWIDTIQAQWNNGVRRWLELGPKGVLSRMVKPNLEGLADSEEAEVSGLASLEDVHAFAAE